MVFIWISVENEENESGRERGEGNFRRTRAKREVETAGRDDSPDRNREKGRGQDFKEEVRAKREGRKWCIFFAAG